MARKATELEQGNNINYRVFLSFQSAQYTKDEPVLHWVWYRMLLEQIKVTPSWQVDIIMQLEILR